MPGGTPREPRRDAGGGRGRGGCHHAARSPGHVPPWDGHAADPVRGVLLDDGRVLSARWVLAADGQRSTVAGRLAVERVQERRGDVAMLLGYWRGLPQSDWIRLDMRESNALMVTPCEDGLHLLTVAGDPSLPAVRAPTWRRVTTRCSHLPQRAEPAAAGPRAADRPCAGRARDHDAGLLPPRRGPGWALVGDAVHFKHPTTGQGIGDALAQAKYVADALAPAGTSTATRSGSRRSAEGYDFSFRVARLPGRTPNGLYAGLAADHDAGQGSSTPSPG